MYFYRRRKKRSALMSLLLQFRSAVEITVGVGAAVALASYAGDLRPTPQDPTAPVFVADRSEPRGSVMPTGAASVASAAALASVLPPQIEPTALADLPEPRLTRALAEDQGFAALLAGALEGRTAEIRRVARGSTMAGLLDGAGVSREERNAAVHALSEVFDLRRLQAGQEVTVYLRRTEEEARLMGLAFEPEEARLVHLTQVADGDFRARDVLTPLTARIVRAEGEITNSLFVDATAQGAHHQTIAEIADLLGYSIDFQREIHPGDRFEILFEEFVDPEGRPVRPGTLYYMAFTPRGRRLEYYRFENEHGEVEYFDAEGRSARRFLMRTPVNGARLSSHFGTRRHPISGYTRMHRGTDFAAPTGTPIYAAGNGVVERANRFGGFGNYVRIRHANGYQTAYAHLHGFARGIRAGVRVRQGQTIGYVGSTGRSTGPHLHYEVIRNGQHVNPMRLNLPTGRSLEDAERAAFMAERDRIAALWEASPSAREAEPVLMAENSAD